MHQDSLVVLENTIQIDAITHCAFLLFISKQKISNLKNAQSADRINLQREQFLLVIEIALVHCKNNIIEQQDFVVTFMRVHEINFILKRTYFDWKQCLCKDIMLLKEHEISFDYSCCYFNYVRKSHELKSNYIEKLMQLISVVTELG